MRKVSFSLLILGASMTAACSNINEPFQREGTSNTFRFSEAGLEVSRLVKGDAERAAEAISGVSMYDVSKCVMASDTRLNAAQSMSRRHARQAAFFLDVWNDVAEAEQRRTGEKIKRRFGSLVRADGSLVNPEEKIDFQKDMYDFCADLEEDIFKNYSKQIAEASK